MPDSGCKHGCRNFGSKKKTQRERVREREREPIPLQLAKKRVRFSSPALGHSHKDKPGQMPPKKKNHPPKDKASKKPFSRGRPAGMLAVADDDLHTEEQRASVPELGEEQSASVLELGVASASSATIDFVPEPESPRPRRSVPHWCQNAYTSAAV